MEDVNIEQGILNVEVGRWSAGSGDPRTTGSPLAKRVASPVPPKTGRNGEAESGKSLLAREKQHSSSARFTTWPRFVVKAVVERKWLPSSELQKVRPSGAARCRHAVVKAGATEGAAAAKRLFATRPTQKAATFATRAGPPVAAVFVAKVAAFCGALVAKVVGRGRMSIVGELMFHSESRRLSSGRCLPLGRRFAVARAQRRIESAGEQPQQHDADGPE